MLYIKLVGYGFFADTSYYTVIVLTIYRRLH